MVKSWNVHIDVNDIAILLEQQHQNIEHMLVAKAAAKFSPPKTKTKSKKVPKTTKSKKAAAAAAPKTKKATKAKAAATAACNEMQTAKYKPPRKSPPFEAEHCQNEIKLGNDQKLYRSVRNEKGEWRWVTALHLALDQQKPPSQRTWIL
jgi:hypothetical protein